MNSSGPGQRPGSGTGARCLRGLLTGFLPAPSRSDTASGPVDVIGMRAQSKEQDCVYSPGL